MPPKIIKKAAVTSAPAPAPAPPVSVHASYCGLSLAHPPPPSAAPLVEEWLAQLSGRDLELQRHAASFLKTSYFIEKTHGFKKWLAKRSA